MLYDSEVIHRYAKVNYSPSVLVGNIELFDLKLRVVSIIGIHGS